MGFLDAQNLEVTLHLSWIIIFSNQYLVAVLYQQYCIVTLSTLLIPSTQRCGSTRKGEAFPLRLLSLKIGRLLFAHVLL